MHVASPPPLDFSQVQWSTLFRDAELKRHDFRETRNFRRRFCIPYELFMDLVKLVKIKLFSLAATDVARRQNIPLKLKISSSCY